jgi:hypothetical protein
VVLTNMIDRKLRRAPLLRRHLFVGARLAMSFSRSHRGEMDRDTRDATILRHRAVKAAQYVSEVCERKELKIDACPFRSIFAAMRPLKAPRRTGKLL